jgi:4'-phosphopantetheinyl transferase
VTHPFELQPDEVHVWIANLDLLAATVDATSLSADERVRAATWRHTIDRDRFVAGRAWLRRVLSSYLALPPAAVDLAAGLHGKPAIQGAAVPLQFNLSHAADRALLAVTLQRAVGIDLECVRVNDDCEAIVRRHFAPGEVAAWLELPASRRLHGFYAGWTRKEAYVKALGAGLGMMALDAFEVSLDPDGAAQLLSIDGSLDAARCWSMWSLDVIPGFAAAVVAEGTEVRLRMTTET